LDRLAKPATKTFHFFASFLVWEKDKLLKIIKLEPLGKLLFPMVQFFIVFC